MRSSRREIDGASSSDHLINAGQLFFLASPFILQFSGMGRRTECLNTHKFFTKVFYNNDIYNRDKKLTILFVIIFIVIFDSRERRVGRRRKDESPLYPPKNKRIEERCNLSSRIAA